MTEQTTTIKPVRTRAPRMPVINGVCASQLPAVQQQNSFLPMIQQAIAHGTTKENLMALIDVQERIMAKDAEMQFNAALADMQPELPTVEKNGAIKFTDKQNVERNTPYALYEDIIEAIRPSLKKYGFSLSFSSDRDGDKVIITGKLAHRAGHSEKVVIPIPLDTSGSKNNVQAIGSSLSYGKRYAVGMLLNIVTRGEDDDGTAAGALVPNPDPLPEDKFMKLGEWLIAAGDGADTSLLQYLKIPALKDIRSSMYMTAVTFLKSRTPGGNK